MTNEQIIEKLDSLTEEVSSTLLSIEELREEVLNSDKPKKIYCGGDVFKILTEENNELWLLTQVGPGDCCLVSLSDHSNRYSHPTHVVRLFDITPEEINKMTEDMNWEYIGKIKDLLK